MVRLVADIGGTNTRLALSQDGVVLEGTQRRFANDDHASFDAVAAQYLEDAAPTSLSEIVAALAGPVGHDSARLTNRDWTLEVADLSDRFGAPSVRLINDLTALGYALPALSGADLLALSGDPAPAKADQSLVVGIGTGFNVCFALAGPSGPVCARAEFGHVSMPSAVKDRLVQVIGARADDFATVEECFSGRGFAALKDMVGPEVDFHQLYGELVGWLARDLRLGFMADAGLYFAGSVARATLQGTGLEAFERAYRTPTAVAADSVPPVRMIMDDMAALKGCAGVVLG